MNTWILFIVMITGPSGITTAQLGPYDNEAQCMQVKQVVEHAMPKGIYSQTLICTRGRNV